MITDPSGALAPVPDLAEIERRWRQRWEDLGVHEYRKEPGATVFSVDTPPPYVSATHLHVGHAMSYAQPDFIVRYRRMRSDSVFYPIGFDDNGLPTERFSNASTASTSGPRREASSDDCASTRRSESPRPTRSSGARWASRSIGGPDIPRSMTTAEGPHSSPSSACSMPPASTAQLTPSSGIPSWEPP
jgi:leucyl-tRNA synthetase